MATAFIRISHRFPVPRNYSCEDAGWEDARRIETKPEKNSSEDIRAGDNPEGAAASRVEDDAISIPV